MIAVDTMRATVFHAPQEFHVEEVDRPRPGPGEALIRVTLTTICGTDVHIVKGEYPVRPGLILGHEPVGVIEELGAGVTGYEVGERVLVGAITPCGQCHACLSGHLSQCGHGTGFEAIGGWRFGNTINGAQAEYLLVPSAQANLAKIPADVTDEQVVLLADIASTGFAGAESGGVRIGDTVVVFAQGPIGLCATAGAKLMGAAQVIGVDSDPVRLAMARRMGADVALDFTKVDVVDEVRRLTKGYGADVAIEALGHAADVRERASDAPSGRDAVQPWGLLRQARAPLRRVRGRARRSPDRHDPLPGWQGADGPPHRDGAGRPVRPDAADHAPLRAEGHRRGLPDLQQPPGRRPEGRDHPVAVDGLTHGAAGLGPAAPSSVCHRGRTTAT